MALVPAAGVSTWAYAAASTVLVAVAALTYRACVTLASLLNLYSAPRIFASDVASRTAAEIVAGADGVAGFKVPALGDMLRMAVRRGDGVALNAALEAIEEITVFWTCYVSEHEAARSLRMPTGPTRPGWLVRDLAQSLARAVDEALRSGTPSDEVDLVIDMLEHLAAAAAIAGLKDECRITVEYLTVVGTTTHQVLGPQTINLIPRPAACLASVERVCEDEEQIALATVCLAHWALVITWMYTQYGHVHPMLFTTPLHFGPHPPWDETRELIDSAPFREHWVNQLHDPALLGQTLDIAAAVHEGREVDLAAVGTSRRRPSWWRIWAPWRRPRPRVLGVPPPGDRPLE